MERIIKEIKICKSKLGSILYELDNMIPSDNLMYHEHLIKKSIELSDKIESLDRILKIIS